MLVGVDGVAGVAEGYGDFIVGLGVAEERDGGRALSTTATQLR